jgi:CTP synthase (UTP-ammonia lyase)
MLLSISPRKQVINADDEESVTEVDLVNERQNIDSPVTRAINLGTAELPTTPQRDHIVNPSISDPRIQCKTSRRRPVP